MTKERTIMSNFALIGAGRFKGDYHPLALGKA